MFEPLEFIGRLAALIPRPHKNLVVYHGVLAPRSKWRARVVAYGRPGSARPTSRPSPVSAAGPLRFRDRRWAVLMRRAFELDVLACPRCSGRLELLACITSPPVIRAILRHLSLPADAPEPQPARAPPWARAAQVYEFYDAFDATDDDPDRAA